MAYSATFSGPMLSLASCDIRVAGGRIVGLTKADMECGVNTEPERGSGPIPLGSAIGTNETTFSFDQHSQEAFALMKRLDGLSGGNGFALVETTVSFTFTGAGVRVSGIVQPVTSIFLKKVKLTKLKPAPSNDGKSIISSWTTVVTWPIAWSVGGGTPIYSINPDRFTTSNTVAIGIGGEVLLGG